MDAKLIQIIPATGWWEQCEPGAPVQPLVAWGLKSDGDVVPLSIDGGGVVDEAVGTPNSKGLVFHEDGPEHPLSSAGFELGMPTCIPHLKTESASKRPQDELPTQISAGDSIETDPDENTVFVRPGLELGVRVHLDEDLAAEAEEAPRVYVFEAYDSHAPVESNCTVTDAITGDWTLRGINELFPIEGGVDTEGGQS